MPILKLCYTVLFFTFTSICFAEVEEIFVGNLYDMTGPTSGIGKFAGQGKIDALEYINAHGGINGKTMRLSHLDYSYKATKAIETYKKWKREGVTVIQGWGTADTEALVGFVSKDKVPFVSLSFSGRLTDPTGRGPNTLKAAPYNFFVGPSYSDGVRALIQWAKTDWIRHARSGNPKYIHMGDNHPYPNAAKAPGYEYAEELDFEIVPPIVYSLHPGEFEEQCLALKESGADYTFLANTGGSNAALLSTCYRLKVKTQFLINVWGMDENTMKEAGRGADGVVWVMSTASWNDRVPGMKLLREISKISDPSGTLYRPVHYIRGVCHPYYMKEAMEWADKNGGINGPNIKKGFYQKQNWVPKGLEGVCGPSSWTATDHRGQTLIPIYQAKVSGDTRSGGVSELTSNGILKMNKIFTADIPRKAEWIGW
ncbi:MAG: ABC transporter substrate-binding protein [SAR324 cluster bacterium]|nr:ABC transporter substrate-binding protein [SAR324 cluster bacterium]